MNVHPDAVFNTVIHFNHEAIPYIMDIIFLEQEVVYLQM